MDNAAIFYLASLSNEGYTHVDCWRRCSACSVKGCWKAKRWRGLHLENL